jgi:hypothetical protein
VTRQPAGTANDHNKQAPVFIIQGAAQQHEGLIGILMPIEA